LTLLFLEQYVDAGTSPMCGNSICQDRRFLARHMPNLEKFFHYRNLDVSTLKELARRWAPELPALDKGRAHLALEDVRESVKELDPTQARQLLDAVQREQLASHLGRRTSHPSRGEKDW